MSDEFEAFDRTWRVQGKSLDVARIRTAAQGVAAAYAGVTVKVDWEDDDTVTCFFGTNSTDGEPLIVELSVYDLGSDGRVLSLEADAGDNDATWDDACQLAEDLAEALGGRALDL